MDSMYSRTSVKGRLTHRKVNLRGLKLLPVRLATVTKRGDSEHGEGLIWANLYQEVENVWRICRW